MREEENMHEKSFLKEISLIHIVKYLFQRIWIVLLGAILVGVLIFVISTMYINKNHNATVQDSYLLIDGNYVYVTLINIRAENTSESIEMETYLSTIVSHVSISKVIEKLELEENFIDIFNKMSWEIQGENVKLKINSPLRDVNGYTWEQILMEIVRQGEIVLRQEFENVNAVHIIDEPYLENVIAKQGENIEAVSINMKVVILGAVVAAILVAGSLLVYYILKNDIDCIGEIEENLDIPVLVVLQKKSILKE